MISHLNKVLLFSTFLAIFYAFSITGRGQEIKYEVRGPGHCKGLKYMQYDPYCVWVPIKAIPTIPSIAFGGVWFEPVLAKPRLIKSVGSYGNGFVILAPLEFGGFIAGDSIFQVGNGLVLIGKDPSILNDLRALEGQMIVITVKPVKKVVD